VAPELYSSAGREEKKALLDGARRVAGSAYPGLDLEQDIRAADEQRLGDTVLLRAAGGRKRFDRLLDAIERFAADRGAERVEAGVSMAREKAFHALRERGYRVGFQGIAMHRPNDPGYSKPAVFAIDDWR
jgi:hypothetical protein